MKKMLFVALALAVVTPRFALGQEATDRELRDLERELRQTETRVRELRRQLDALRGERGPVVHYRDMLESMRPFVSVFGNRARLGVTVRTAADSMMDARGAVIEGVQEDGPAAEAGIEAGDVITHFDGDPLVGRYPPADDDESEPAIKLIDMARELEEGDTVELRYLRDGQERTAQVVARELNSFTVLGGGDWMVAPRVEVLLPSRLRIAPEGPIVSVFIRGRWNDLELVNLNEDLGAYFGTTAGVLVVRAPEDGPLDLKSGDVIVKIGDREPTSPTRALRILRNYEPGETVTMEVMRQKRRITLTGEISEAEVHRQGRHLEVRRRRSST